MSNAHLCTWLYALFLLKWCPLHLAGKPKGKPKNLMGPRMWDTDTGMWESGFGMFRFKQTYVLGKYKFPKETHRWGTAVMDKLHFEEIIALTSQVLLQDIQASCNMCGYCLLAARLVVRSSETLRWGMHAQVGWVASTCLYT